MLSIIDKATLLTTPNAYMEGKLFSIIPDTGAGDMNVISSTINKTRVNDKGYLEIGPKNLLSYTRAFNDPYWDKSFITVTDNTVASPDGNINASILTEVAGTSSFHLHELNGSFTPSIGTIYTMSCYVKKPLTSADRYVQLPFWLGGFGLEAYANFDLQTLTKGTAGSSIISSSIESDTNDWIRISVTAAATTTTLSGFQISFVPSATATRTEPYTAIAGNENSLYFYGPQVEINSFVTSYFPITDKLNIPRIDFTYNACPVILVEPASTNLCKYSEDLTNWSIKGSVLISPNATFAPNKTLTADKLIATATPNQRHAVYKVITNVTSEIITASVYVKSGEYKYACLSSVESTNSVGALIIINIEDGTLFADNVGGGVTYKYKVFQLANGWKRIVLTMYNPAGSFPTWMTVGGFHGGSYTINSQSLQPNFTGDNVSGIYIWGSQFELGENLSSYIPTLAVSVTRNDESISVTPPASTIKITTYFEGNQITETSVIPGTYVMPYGRIKTVLMQYTL